MSEKGKVHGAQETSGKIMNISGLIWGHTGEAG